MTQAPLGGNNSIFTLTTETILLCFRDNILDGAVVFTLLFGSELFEDYIGHLAMATMASSEMTSGDNDNLEKLQDRLKVGRHFRTCD